MLQLSSYGDDDDDDDDYGDDGDDDGDSDDDEEGDDDYENVYFIVNIFNQNVVKRCLRRIVCASRLVSRVWVGGA